MNIRLIVARYFLSVRVLVRTFAGIVDDIIMVVKIDTSRLPETSLYP
jgi:hypothetical protein